MKLSVIAFLAAFPASAGAQCSFCPDGLMVDGGTAVPNSGGETCGSLLSAAPNLEADEFGCLVAQGAEGICCSGEVSTPTNQVTAAPVVGGVEEIPTDTVASPCQVCTGGLTADGGTALGGGKTCADLIVDALAVEETSNTCAAMKGDEATCCPPAAADPCVVCVDGLTVDGATALGNGKTCADLIVDAVSTEATSNVCTAMQGDEATCCPTAAEEPCAFCADGLTEEAIAADAGNGQTCNDLVAEALLIEATDDACAALQASEAACCPAPLENPCQVCIDGLTADEATVITGTRTCGGLITDALVTEDTSDVCTQMKTAELLCCPSPAEVPCPVCPDGITVDPTTEAVNGKTCEDLVADALNIEETDEVCTNLLARESVCCPTPCSFCATGNVTLKEEVEVGGDTCAELAAEALLVDETSNQCTTLKAAEAQCCPPPADDPCLVCVDGITVEATMDLGNGKTCGDLVVDALTTEATSNVCTAMQGDEATCCPAVPTIAPAANATVAPTVNNATVAPTVNNVTVAPSAAPNATASPTANETTVAPTSAGTTPAPTAAVTSDPTVGSTQAAVTPSPTPSPVAAIVTPNPTDGLENLPPSAGTQPPPTPPAPSGGVAASGLGGSLVLGIATALAILFV